MSKERRFHNWALISNFIQQRHEQCMSLGQYHVQCGSGGKEKQEVAKWFWEWFQEQWKLLDPRALLAMAALVSFSPYQCLDNKLSLSPQWRTLIRHLNESFMPAQNAQAMFNVKQLIRSSNYQAKDNYQSRKKLRKKKKSLFKWRKKQ